ncbi:hypothetical protein ACJRO7_035881 [Eucalyptus globulus]|uniref:Radical SAM core domain-containing protein n=1 Tax=Eucalyptus globulus TaxID=34317 RepID=A0ABD3JJ47_EUCGL
MRFRYTSPHPKDFPDELQYLMRDRHNICKYIHLPAQTGSSTVLERMRRGYTHEAYLDLVQKIREMVPQMGIRTDFICGFCGETEEEHEDTLSPVRTVGYVMAYMFAHSMGEKTHANRNSDDDVPEEVKQRRLNELIEAFRESTGQSPDGELIGKSDRGHRVSFAKLLVIDRADNSTCKRNSSVASLFGESLVITKLSLVRRVQDEELVACESSA